MNTQKRLCILLLCLAAVSLSGCGIRPSDLEDPTPETKSDFPAQYPKNVRTIQ